MTDIISNTCNLVHSGWVQAGKFPFGPLQRHSCNIYGTISVRCFVLCVFEERVLTDYTSETSLDTLSCFPCCISFPFYHYWCNKKKEEKLFLEQATDACRVVRRRGSHILQTVGSQMAVRLSALRACLPLFPGRFLLIISVTGWVNTGAGWRNTYM
jgi:hypothetical protein